MKKIHAAGRRRIRNTTLTLRSRQSSALIWMCDFPGGLFHPSDDKQEVAFRYAVEKINANRDILPKSRLSAQIEQIKPQDSFHASKRGESVVPFQAFVHSTIKRGRFLCKCRGFLVYSTDLVPVFPGDIIPVSKRFQFRRG